MIIYNIPKNSTIKIDHLLPEGIYYYLFVDIFTESNALPPDILLQVKNKELKLVFDLSYEGWIHAPKMIHDLFIKPYDLDSNDLILLTGSFSAQNDTNIFCKSIGIKPFKTIWHLPMMRDIALELKNKQKALHHNNILKFLIRKDKKITKCFLNFNRRWRYHRPALVGLFKIYDILDKGYVSLTKADDNIDWNIAYENILYFNNHNSQFTELWINNKDKIMSIPSLTLDFEDLTENKANLDLSADYYYYNSYFSVVSETNFYQSLSPSIFFSEKTFKPMAFKHPFILVTVPHSLNVLRSLGYQTFSPFIDESYDLETDDTLRMFKILTETKRLCDLSDIERSQFIENITPIVNHNYNILLNTVIKP